VSGYHQNHILPDEINPHKKANTVQKIKEFIQQKDRLLKQFGMNIELIDSTLQPLALVKATVFRKQTPIV